MKRILTAICNYFEWKRNEVRTFNILKRNLRRGFYYFPSNKSILKKLDIRCILPKNLFHIYFNSHNNGDFSCLDFGRGCGKTVLLTKHHAYGYYYSEHGYNMSKHNFEAVYDKFNYPCVSGISFNDESKCIKMDRVKGKVFSDSWHDEIIVEKMIAYLVDAEVIEIHNEICFLQHGDAQRLNVLWNENDSFTFIDLDNMKYYPPMLDVFHYLNVAGYTLEKILTLMNKNRTNIEKICLKAGIDCEKNYIDELFYRYVKHFANMGGCYENFSFLNRKNTITYPKTNSLLKSI